MAVGGRRRTVPDAGSDHHLAAGNWAVGMLAAQLRKMSYDMLFAQPDLHHWKA